METRVFILETAEKFRRAVDRITKTEEQHKGANGIYFASMFCLCLLKVKILS